MWWIGKFQFKRNSIGSAILRNRMPLMEDLDQESSQGRINGRHFIFVVNAVVHLPRREARQC